MRAHARSEAGKLGLHISLMPSSSDSLKNCVLNEQWRETWMCTLLQQISQRFIDASAEMTGHTYSTNFSG